MKRIISVLLIILLLFVSCYMPIGEQLTLTITDQGTLRSNSYEHVIKIECSNPYAVIFYRTDGAKPDISSKIYNEGFYELMNGSFAYGEPIPCGSEIVAVAIKEGCRNSPYSFYSVPYVYKTTSTPKISDHGTYYYDRSLKVIEIYSMYGSSIRYTIDGSMPSNSSNEYKEGNHLTTNGYSWDGILVPKGKTIKAIATYPGYFDSIIKEYYVRYSDY